MQLYTKELTGITSPRKYCHNRDQGKLCSHFTPPLNSAVSANHQTRTRALGRREWGAWYWLHLGLHAHMFSTFIMTGERQSARAPRLPHQLYRLSARASPGLFTHAQASGDDKTQRIAWSKRVHPPRVWHHACVSIKKYSDKHEYIVPESIESWGHSVIIILTWLVCPSCSQQEIEWVWC